MAQFERQGALTAVSAGEAVVPASELAAARAEIAKLQRVLGKKTFENEILKEAVEHAAEKSGLRARPFWTGRQVKAVCQALGLARSNVHRLRIRPENWIDAGTQRQANVSDATLLDEIKLQITELPTYGCRLHSPADVVDDGAVAAAIALGLYLSKQGTGAAPSLLGPMAVGCESLMQGRLERRELDQAELSELCNNAHMTDQQGPVAVVAQAVAGVGDEESSSPWRSSSQLIACARRWCATEIAQLS